MSVVRPQQKAKKGLGPFPRLVQDVPPTILPPLAPSDQKERQKSADLANISVYRRGVHTICNRIVVLVVAVFLTKEDIFPFVFFVWLYYHRMIRTCEYLVFRPFFMSETDVGGVRSAVVLATHSRLTFWNNSNRTTTVVFFSPGTRCRGSVQQLCLCRGAFLLYNVVLRHVRTCRGCGHHHRACKVLVFQRINKMCVVFACMCSIYVKAF